MIADTQNNLPGVTDKTHRYFFYCYLLFAILKLLLIGNYELGSGGFDAGEYARLAFDKYWFPERTGGDLLWDLRRGPGLPLLSIIFRSTGIPYVLCLESLHLLLFLGLGFFSLRCFPLPVVVFASAFAVFSPATYTEQLFMSDQPYAVLFSYLALFMGISVARIKRNEPPGLILNVSIAFFAVFCIITRGEGFLIYIYVITYFVVIYWVKNEISGKKIILRICLILFLISASVICIKSLNYYKYGFYGTSVRPRTNGIYSILHKVSLSTGHNPSSVSSNGITIQAIQITADASPAFAKTMAPYLIQWQKKWKNRKYIRALEINNLLRVLKKEDMNPKQGILWLEQTQKEIENHIDQKYLSVFYVYPFGNTIIQPGYWFINLPKSMVKVMKYAYGGFQYRFIEAKDRGVLFNIILNRRSALVQGNDFGIRGDIRRWLGANYVWLAFLTILGVGAYSVYYLKSAHCIEMKKNHYLPFLFIVFIIFCRMAAYTALDAFAFPQTARHIVNMNPILLYISILAPFVAVCFGAKAVKQWSNNQ